MSLVLAGFAFVPSAVSWLERLAEAAAAQWDRVTVPMCFGLAILAGVGVDLLVRDQYDRRVVRATAGAFAGAALLLTVVWIFTTSSGRTVFRTSGFLWTGISAILGLAVAGTLWAQSRPRPGRASRPIVFSDRGAPALPSRKARSSVVGSRPDDRL